MNRLLALQKEYQHLLADTDMTYAGELCYSIKDMAFYLNQEVIELIEEIAGSRDINKPWKMSHYDTWYKEIDITDKVKSEAIDVLKFALNIVLLAGIDETNIDEEFDKVHTRCLERLQNGY